MKSISHWGIMNQDVDNAIGGFKNDCLGLLLDGGSESRGDFGDTSPDGIVQCVASVTMADASPTKTIGGCELASTGNAIVDAEMRQPIIYDHEMTEKMFANAKPAKQALAEIYGAEFAEEFLNNNREHVAKRGTIMEGGITPVHSVPVKDDALGTPPTQTNDSRHAFEAWAGKYDHLGMTKQGTYTTPSTQHKWEGWCERESSRGLEQSAVDYSIKLQKILESVFYLRKETPHKNLYHGARIAEFKDNFNRTLLALKFGEEN